MTRLSATRRLVEVQERREIGRADEGFDITVLLRFLAAALFALIACLWGCA